MKWMQVGLKLLPYIVSAVKSVEQFFTAGKGKDKEDAAVATVHGILEVVEAGAGKDLLTDEKVIEAVRNVMKAIVSLENVIQELEETW